MEEKISLVNWPQEDGLYKVVQMEIDGDSCLRLGRGVLHANILKDTLDGLGIEYELIVGDSHPDGNVGMGETRVRTEIPSPTGTRYQAVGMGYADVQTADKVAVFSRSSKHYSIGINSDHISRMQEIIPEWKLKTNG
ncbi:MAG: hypothetical protein ABIH37_02085 [archaeon]